MRVIIGIIVVVATAAVFLIAGIFLSGKTSIVSVGGASASADIDGVGSFNLSQW